jgi:hypothetical protein
LSIREYQSTSHVYTPEEGPALSCYIASAKGSSPSIVWAFRVKRPHNGQLSGLVRIESSGFQEGWAEQLVGTFEDGFVDFAALEAAGLPRTTL